MQHYLTTAEVAAHYRTASSTVRYRRHIGYGPKGTKVGRRFLYPAALIEEFDQQLLAATASNGAAPVYQPGATAGNDEEAGYQPASPVEQSALHAKRSG